MSAAPFADPIDVAAIWRPLSEAETTLAVGLIDEASRMVAEIPAVTARIIAGTLTAETLQSVCAQMVKRVMLNPDGLRQYSVSIDDGTKSGTFDDTVRGGLVLLPAELNRLLGLVDAPSGAFTISPWYTGI